MNEQNEKQAIEEMANTLWHLPMDFHLNCYNDCVELSKILIKEKYRKQIKSVWSTSFSVDVTAQKIISHGHICQSCFYSYKDISPFGHKFCPNCGAKMKGGAE